MASKTIEEYLKTVRPEQLAELKKDGQDLQRNGTHVAKEGYQELPVTDPSKANTKSANHSLASNQDIKSVESTRGADKIKQFMPDPAKTQATDQGKSLEKSGVETTKQHEPER